jgi:hypothetical protein
MPGNMQIPQCPVIEFPKILMLVIDILKRGMCSIGGFVVGVEGGLGEETTGSPGEGFG